eukprot:1138736-Pelagomonas_calceolata.AAC.4
MFALHARSQGMNGVWFKVGADWSLTRLVLGKLVSLESMLSVRQLCPVICTQAWWHNRDGHITSVNPTCGNIPYAKILCVSMSDQNISELANP